MRKRKAVHISWARPQAFVGAVVAVFVVVGGFEVMPSILRPSQVASVPVIEPIQAQQVESVAIAPTPSTAVNCAAVACLALTFDDGPDAEVTPRVLEILARHNAKATFFLIGLHVPGNEELVRRIHNEGHEVGNHTWSHGKLTDMSPQQLEDDVARAQTVITAAGVPTPRLFRPPYGIFTPMVRSHVPMTVVSWNVDPEDWKAKKPEKIVEHVLANAKPGAIVDLHDIYDITADALDPILIGLEQTYHLVTVSELLDLPPGQPGIFYGR